MTTDEGKANPGWGDRVVIESARTARLEERRAVVAWLRRTANRRRIGSGALAAAELEDAADSIVRGEHLS